MRTGEPCSEPICHLQVPTLYDKTLTDRDGHICSIWGLYAPPRLATGTWEERREEVGEGVIDYVTRFVPNFRSAIREWMFMSPWDIEQRTGITDGAIRHLDVVPSQFLNVHAPATARISATSISAAAARTRRARSPALPVTTRPTTSCAPTPDTPLAS